MLDEMVFGSPDNLSGAEIQTRVWPVMENRACKSRELALESFRQNANTTRTAFETSDILTAAYQGRIETLFVDRFASIPGAYNPSDLTLDYDVPTTDCDLDLTEDAIAQTLFHRGRVFAIHQDELPKAQSMVANLRF